MGRLKKRCNLWVPRNQRQVLECKASQWSLWSHWSHTYTLKINENSQFMNIYIHNMLLSSTYACTWLNCNTTKYWCSEINVLWTCMRILNCEMLLAIKGTYWSTCMPQHNTYSLHRKQTNGVLADARSCKTTISCDQFAQPETHRWSTSIRCR